MKSLKILQGNDIYVKLNVVVHVNGASPKEKSFDIDLTEVESMQVFIVPISGRIVSPEWAISETSKNLLYIKLADLSCGSYGIEVRGFYKGRKVRAYYSELIKVVHTDTESDTANGIYDGFDYYEPDDPFVVQFSGVVLPYFKLNPKNGHLYVTNMPDGGNIKIENNHLKVIDNEGY